MAQHMAQQNAEGSRDLSTLVDASAELQHLVQTILAPASARRLPVGPRTDASEHRQEHD